MVILAVLAVTGVLAGGVFLGVAVWIARRPAAGPAPVADRTPRDATGGARFDPVSRDGEKSKTGKADTGGRTEEEHRPKEVVRPEPSVRPRPERSSLAGMWHGDVVPQNGGEAFYDEFTFRKDGTPVFGWFDNGEFREQELTKVGQSFGGQFRGASFNARVDVLDFTEDSVKYKVVRSHREPDGRTTVGEIERSFAFAPGGTTYTQRYTFRDPPDSAGTTTTDRGTLQPASPWMGTWKGELTGKRFDGTGKVTQPDLRITYFVRFAANGQPVWLYSNNGKDAKARFDRPGGRVRYVPRGGGIQSVELVRFEAKGGKVSYVLKLHFSKATNSGGLSTSEENTNLAAFELEMTGDEVRASVVENSVNQYYQASTIAKLPPVSTKGISRKELRGSLKRE